MLQAFGPDLLQMLALVNLRFRGCQQRFLVGLILGASSTRTAVAGFVAAVVGVCAFSQWALLSILFVAPSVAVQQAGCFLPNPTSRHVARKFRVC